jgi:hypothetical protein
MWLARLQKQNVAARLGLPSYGVARRNIYDLFTLSEDDLDRGPNCTDDANNIPFIVVDGSNACVGA